MEICSGKLTSGAQLQTPETGGAGRMAARFKAGERCPGKRHRRKMKTKAAKAAVSIPGPRADRPVAKGYGLKDPKDGLLPWSWAEEQLAKSRTYWISTARSGGRPHTMPVWGGVGGRRILVRHRRRHAESAKLTAQSVLHGLHGRRRECRNSGRHCRDSFCGKRSVPARHESLRTKVQNGGPGRLTRLSSGPAPGVRSHRKKLSQNSHSLAL